MDPALADAEIYAKQCDILLLALVGLVVVQSGRWTKARYSHDDENFVLAANRLQNCAQSILKPCARRSLMTKKMDCPASSIKRLQTQFVTHWPISWVASLCRLMPCLMSSPDQMSFWRSMKTFHRLSLLSQRQRHLQRLPLSDQCWLKLRCRIQRQVIPNNLLQKSFGSRTSHLRSWGHTKIPSRKWLVGLWSKNIHACRCGASMRRPRTKRAATVSKLLCAGGLAQKTADKSVLQLLKPPVDEIEDICQQIADTISMCKDSEIKQMQEQMGKRNLEPETWSVEAFKSMLRLCGEGFNWQLQVVAGVLKGKALLRSIGHASVLNWTACLEAGKGGWGYKKKHIAGISCDQRTASRANLATRRFCCEYPNCVYAQSMKAYRHRVQRTVQTMAGAIKSNTASFVINASALHVDPSHEGPVTKSSEQIFCHPIGLSGS